MPFEFLYIIFLSLTLLTGFFIIYMCIFDKTLSKDEDEAAKKTLIIENSIMLELENNNYINQKDSIINISDGLYTIFEHLNSTCLPVIVKEPKSDNENNMQIDFKVKKHTFEQKKNPFFEDFSDFKNNNVSTYSAYYYNELSGKFDVYLDQKLLNDFKEDTPFENLDIKNDFNIFILNLCYTVLLELLHMKDVILKTFVYESRDIGTFLKLSLYNKHNKINLLNYINQKITILREQTRNTYNSKENVLYFKKFRFSSIRENEIFEQLKKNEHHSLQNHIKKLINIIKTWKMTREDTCFEIHSITKISTFIKRCYSNLINYMLLCIVDENNSISDEIYKKRIRKIKTTK